MDLLVLGGTHHVGRCVVEVALEHGHSVTTLNRGLTGTPVAGVTELRADRLDESAMTEALGRLEWDAVIDTWSGAPRAVDISAGLLAGRAGHYGYVSSRSVYKWPIPPAADESVPVVEADARSLDHHDYAAAKRGGELAALVHFPPDRVVLARAGLILGPYEQIGRLPWWLRRLAAGGPVLAPGPAIRPLQYIDGRDLAAWMIGMAAAGRSGAFNTVSRPGHTTIGQLLDCAVSAVGGDAELVWAAPEVIASAGIAGWTELPIWLPPEGEEAALHDGDVEAAMTAGLTCRPVTDTVEDTWAWMQAEGDPARASDGSVGLDPAREKAVLASLLDHQ